MQHPEGDNPIWTFKVQISSNKDSWYRNKEQIERLLMIVLKNEGVLDIHSIKLIETEAKI